jgi:hypothetical protein
LHSFLLVTQPHCTNLLSFAARAVFFGALSAACVHLGWLGFAPITKHTVQRGSHHKACKGPKRHMYDAVAVHIRSYASSVQDGGIRLYAPAVCYCAQLLSCRHAGAQMHWAPAGSHRQPTSIKINPPTTVYICAVSTAPASDPQNGRLLLPSPFAQSFPAPQQSFFTDKACQPPHQRPRARGMGLWVKSSLG